MDIKRTMFLLLTKNLETGFSNSAMLITSFHILKRMGARNIDQIWNLVLSCKNCNRGEDGKFEKVSDEF